MEEVKYSSSFNSLQRLRRTQVEWIKENKQNIGAKTVAGCLDIIINSYKNEQT